jgi:transposase
VFEQSREGLLVSLRAGANIDESARHVGVSVHTVRTWLRNGRKDPDGRYGAFAAEVDAVRESQRLPDHATLAALTREEVEAILAEKARAGSIPAIRVWLDLHRAEFEEPAAGDELSWLDRS